MFNVGGPEVLVILLVALIVLGPQQLPKAVRSVGNVMSELRRMSSGFQDEIRNALDVSTEAEARREGAELARRPEDADITETVARNTEDAHDDSRARAPLEVHSDEASHNGSGGAANPPRSAPGPQDHDDWIPSDRASG
jgi:sec-independent protein translocase protein TatB